MPVTIFEAVLGNLAVASALAAVALAVGRWANRPALAHALWLLVLVKLVTPPLVAIPIHCLPAKPEQIATAPAARPCPAGAAEVSPVVIVEPPSRSAVAPSSSSPEQPRAAAAVTEVAGPSEAARGVAPAARWVPAWDVALLGVWVAGAAASLAVAARRARRFSRLLRFATAPPAGMAEEVAATAERMGLRRAPRVRVVPGGIAPLVWAVGRPTLYFPAGLLARLTPEQRLALIGHEVAHLRRWDHLVRLVEFLAVAVYWWCPLAWLARRELRRLEEEACDADVVASVPGSGFAYASAILETIDYLAGVAPAPALASGIGDAASLRRRLVLILGGSRPARTSLRSRLVLVAGGLALLAAGPELHRLRAAAATPQRRAEPTPEHPAGFPVVGEEVFIEPVQFLPTPSPLLGKNAGKPTLASALSPDGTRLAVAVGADVVVWDLAAKRPLFTLRGHTENVNALAFSPDGSHIATASNDTTAIIWDAAGGTRLHTLTWHGRWVLAAAFSPDGRTLATGGYDKTVRLWDTETGQAKATWRGHNGGVRALAFSPDSRTLATGGADAEVRLWDVARGTTTFTLKKHEASVRVVCFSPDGSRLASGSEDRTVRLWSPADGREMGPPVALPEFVTSLGFSRRGQVLLAGTAGGHVLNINPVTGQARGYVGVEPGEPAGSPAHAGAVTAILTPPDGRTTVYTISQDGAAMAWTPAGPPQAARLNFRTSQGMTAVALSPDGLTLATGGQDGMIRLWDAATARELVRLPGHPGGVSSLIFGAGGQLVSAGLDERVRVWDTRSGRATHAVIQPTADLCIAISPDGRTLAIGGRKLPGITLLELAGTGKPRRCAEWAGEVSAVAFTPAGDRIASGYTDGVFRVWDRKTGEEVVRGRAGTGSVDGIAFDPAAATAAVVVNEGGRGDGEAAGPTHAVVFLSARDGSELDDFRTLAHPGPVTAAAFAGGQVLTAAHDGNLYVWNPATGRVVRTIRGHADAVRGVAMAPNGTAVFSAGDRAAKMWPMTKEKKSAAADTPVPRASP